MLQIPRDIIRAMISHAELEAPNECCGLLAGDKEGIKEVYPISNLPSDHPSIIDLKVPADRRFRYVMDPKEQISASKKMRRSGNEIRAIYHSHPHSPAYPSPTDVRLAFYPDVYYLIISLEKKENPHVRAFQIVGAEIIEEEILKISSQP